MLRPANGTTPLLALLLASPMLAGCILVDGGGCSFVLPPPGAGDTYEYAAAGDLMLMPDFHVVFADWNASSNPTEGQGPVRLAEGFLLTLRISNDTEPRMSMFAEIVESYRLSVKVWDAEKDATLHVQDEWLSANDSNIVQMVTPNIQVIDASTTWHQMRFGLIGRPPLLFTGLFWGERMSYASSGSTSFPAELFTVPTPPAEHRGLESVHWRSIRSYKQPDGCRVQIEAAYENPDRDKIAGYSLTFQEGISVPVRITETVPGGERDRVLRMILEQANKREGPPLDEFTPWTYRATRLPLENRSDGFFPGTGSVFPTSFEEAMEAVRNDMEASQWLANHPNARVAKVVHRMGAQGGKTVDGWSIYLANPESETFQAIVRREYVLPPLNMTDLRVYTHTDKDERYAKKIDDPVAPLSAMNNLSRHFYDKDVEVAYCEIFDRSCYIGPHEAMAYPRIGEGSGFFRAGVVLWPGKGWILQEDSLSDAAWGSRAGPS